MIFMILPRTNSSSYLKLAAMKNILLFLIFGFTPIFIMAQEQMETAASVGLGKFKRLGLLQHSKENLFTAADTTNLQLGNPIQTAIVPIDKLKQYKEGQPASSFITDIDEYVYPVVNGQSKRLSGTMTLAKVNARWSAIRVNAENLILQDSTSKFISQGSIRYKLVKILAFHVSFLSYVESGNILFIPLMEDRERELFLGKLVKAEIVLEKFVKAANDYNGLPM
jgi:hypothetical protein